MGESDPTVGVNLASSSPESETTQEKSGSYPENPFETLRQTMLKDAGVDEEERDKQNKKNEGKGDPIVVTKKVQDDIQGKILFVLSMVTMAATPVDPICIPALNDNLPQITEKLVPIICKSEDMVNFFTKAGGFMLYLELAAALWPVAQVVIAHHVTHTVRLHEGQIQQRDMSQYRAR